MTFLCSYSQHWCPEMPSSLGRGYMVVTLSAPKIRCYMLTLPMRSLCKNGLITTLWLAYDNTIFTAFRIVKSMMFATEDWFRIPHQFIYLSELHSMRAFHTTEHHFMTSVQMLHTEPHGEYYTGTGLNTLPLSLWKTTVNYHFIYTTPEKVLPLQFLDYIKNYNR